MELTLEQALQKGIEAHKTGKAEEASRYYKAILKANPKHPDANHNMGVLAVGVGKVQEALPFFKNALETNARIAQYWLSYINALIKLDQTDEAQAVLKEAKQKGAKGDAFDQIELKLLSSSQNTNAQKPPQEELNTLIKLYNENRLQQVFNNSKKLTKRYATNLTLWNLMGASAAQIGRLDEAVTAFQKAIRIKPNDADTYNNMGNALQKQGKLEESIEAYTKAISINIYYSKAYSNIGLALYEQGKLEKAVEACEKAISIQPDYAEAYNNMGLALQDQGRLEDAIEAYKKAISIQPDYAGAWLNGADIFEKWNKLDQLETWLNKAANSFEIFPDDLKFMRSKLLWRNKKYEEAFYLISDVKFETISERKKRDYQQFKAKCFEKSKNFEQAYDCFAKCNSLAKKSNEYLRCDPENYFQNLKNELDKLKLNLHKIPKAQSTKNPEFLPTFLVGFPRSGTTLLDTILRSNSKISVAEEQDMLRSAENFLKKNGHNDFVRELIPQQLKLEAQKIYLREFNRHIDTILSDKVYVDKLPLSLLKAPLIHQLYPDAKFILALRHPMDTILSCWMQNFKINSAMANMLDIDRTVDFYCIAMETFKICRANYNLNVHEIRYEDLINNFKNEAEAVVQFLNLKWEPEMENYQDTALNRGRIYTPSYSQVVQPIYKDAQNRWRNYQKYLEKYLEQVKPWISEFGYE